jgi:hypothetical protein
MDGCMKNRNKTDARTVQIKVRPLMKNVYQLIFPNQREMALTMLRPQEYYENPKFRGKVFTNTEFKRWYSKRMGSFTYAEDWDGFNIPGWIIKMLRHGTMNPLTAREQRLLSVIPNGGEEFYIIAANTNDNDTLMHEVSHAMFYLNKTYKSRVLTELRRHNTTEIATMLRKLSYCDEVIEDETVAYLLFTRDYMIDKGLNIKKHRLLVIKLTTIFNDEYAKSK